MIPATMKETFRRQSGTAFIRVFGFILRFVFLIIGFTTFQSRKIYPSNLIDVLLILCLLNAFFMLRDETRGRAVFGERGDTPLQSQESLSCRENYSNTSGEF